jgi:hypothetical protein
MIAAVMGTGKSAMTVYLCVEEAFELILILCPLRLVQVWRPQFGMHSDVPFLAVPLDDSFSSVRAKRAEAERQITLAEARGVPVVIVINYDSAWRSPFAEWALKQKWIWWSQMKFTAAKPPAARPAGSWRGSARRRVSGWAFRGRRCRTRRSMFTPTSASSTRPSSAGAFTNSASTTR